MDFELETQWRLAGSEALDQRLFELLDAVARGGTLRYAAEVIGCSYRHAWGLVESAEQLLGRALVLRVKGRGAELTPAGELLRDLRRETEEQLAAPLAEAAERASRRWRQALPETAQGLQPRLAASHGYGIGVLRDLLERHDIPVDMHVYGSEAAVQRYVAEQCEMAGFHLPRGELGRPIAAGMLRELQGRRDALAVVETREQGFITRRGEACESLEQLVREKRRFVNRQPGAGSRLVFDALLAAAGIAAGRVKGYGDEEHTHNAVAALVASGAVGVAFGIRAAAEAFDLEFRRVLVEDYFIVWRRDRLEERMQRAIEAQLASRAFARRCPRPRGCAPLAPGTRFTVAELRRRHGVQ